MDSQDVIPGDGLPEDRPDADPESEPLTEEPGLPEETREAQAEAASEPVPLMDSDAESNEVFEVSEAGAELYEPSDEVYEEGEDYPASSGRSGTRTALVAFLLLLIVGVVVVALFQFNRGLSLPSGLTALLGGIQSTASGLQIEEMNSGTGPAVRAGDAITVHYTGYLEDGTQFDSSIPRGEPFTFVVGYGFVIPGWDEGVQGMQVGGVRRLTIPPDLAYGETGAGDVIPPDSTITFDVELLGIHTTEIEDLVSGEGREAAPGDTVSLEYTVWLMDGTEIDSSRTAGQPIVFTVGAGQMLPGIEQGVLGMQVGGKRLLTIPPALAFGDQGLGDLVPPDASLQFELELVDLEEQGQE